MGISQLNSLIINIKLLQFYLIQQYLISKTLHNKKDKQLKNLSSLMNS
ncbi:unnamed protein product [Paramecium octaurelia]|uniref:Uncharacterized protein n=1 Tax=Paramecium octaurelia TaxID=43137 RepID=A0A8S1TTZ3_PAROT|nr:unnamed protein product [Paramecium octaurelia]